MTQDEFLRECQAVWQRPEARTVMIEHREGTQPARRL
jgi:hypothetical protein